MTSHRRSQHSVQPISGLRSIPLRVGIQLRSMPSSTSTSLSLPLSNEMHSSSNDSTCSTATYDASIMHRVVPATLFDAIVKYDATPFDISTSFNVPLSYVSSHWITSRTSQSLPYNIKTKESYNDENPVLQRRASLPPTQLDAYRNLAHALRKSLVSLQHQQREEQQQNEIKSNIITQQQQPSSSSSSSFHPISTKTTTRPSMHVIAPSIQLPSHHETHSQILRKLATNACCGFATTGTHADLTLTSNRRTVTKRGKGLYRVARSAFRTQQQRTIYYAEVKIEDACGQGGICVGVTTTDTPLNRVIGTTQQSAGLHSAGKTVVCDIWRDASCQFSKQGDIVSILVDIEPYNNTTGSPLSVPSSDDDTANIIEHQHQQQQENNKNRARISFFVNSQPSGNAILDLKNNNKTGLHVAVSLYRNESSVTLKCCRRSWTMFDEILKSLTTTSTSTSTSTPTTNNNLNIRPFCNNQTRTSSEQKQQQREEEEEEEDIPDNDDITETQEQEQEHHHHEEGKPSSCHNLHVCASVMTP